MGNKVYCGNLSYSVTKADLEAMFAEYGAVRSADLVMDRDTGQSKGFGFVEMENAADAQKAIQGLNDVMHDGRPLKVNEAKPREDRGGSRGNFNRSGGGRRW